MNAYELKASRFTWDICPCRYSIDNENHDEVMRELALDLTEDILHDAFAVEPKIVLNLAELTAYGLELDKFFIINTCTGKIIDTPHETIAAQWAHKWLIENNEESAIYTVVIDTDMTCGAKYAYLACSM